MNMTIIMLPNFLSRCALLWWIQTPVMAWIDVLKALQQAFPPNLTGSSPPVPSRWTVSVGGWDARLPCEAVAGTSWSFPSPPGWMDGLGPHKASKWLAGFCTATSPQSASASTSLFCLCRGTTWSMLYPKWFEYGANISLFALLDKDFVVWALLMGSSQTRHTAFVSVVSIKPKRHNQWWFCHMSNAAWCQRWFI